MRILNRLVLVFLTLFVLGCNHDYSEFEREPNYIKEASGTLKAYYDAYDKSLELWEVPFKELYVPTSYGTAHVVVSGNENSEPLLLLHGMDASSTMWYPNIKALSEEYRVFAIDFLLEPGKSMVKADIDDMDTVSIWYHDIVKQLELDKFSIIGASKGGWLAVNMALHNQEKIKKLILLSPAQTFIWIRPSEGLFDNILSLFQSNSKRLETNLETMSFNPDKIHDIFIKQYALARELDTENSLTVNMSPFTKHELQSLNMPVLVLIGDEDMINNQKTITLTNELLPQGKGKVVANAGHFLSIDQAEEVNKEIIEFLNN